MSEKSVSILNVVALVVACVAVGFAINVHRSIPRMETCYTYDTHTFSGELDHATWFAGGTMFYYYEDGEDELSWVDVPQRAPLEPLAEGDIITVTKEYKMVATCLGGRLLDVSNVAVDVRVVEFSIWSKRGMYIWDVETVEKEE